MKTKFLVNSRITTKLNCVKEYRCSPKTKFELLTMIHIMIQNENLYNLNCIDVSNITDMSYLFYNNTYPIEIIKKLDISEWNVSNVTDMCNMFKDVKAFNGKTLENWDVSNVTNMRGMFAGCEDLNCNLNNWDVSNVTDMAYMFTECCRFNSPLDKWNVSKVCNMQGMFQKCTFFNKDLNSWNVNIKDPVKMKCQFNGCYHLNQKPKWYVQK
ncbi:MAG: DUF285 domain-containing protein [Clostridia bacterium]|nr:DUF285 domain-containing protein [Clostridia bacterium]